MKYVMMTLVLVTFAACAPKPAPMMVTPPATPVFNPMVK